MATIPSPRATPPELTPDLLTLTDPDDLLPALGPVPVEPAAQREWIDAYKDRIAMRRSSAELKKAVAEASKAEIDLAEARRRDADARAEAGRALVYTFYAEVSDESVRSAMQTLGTWARREPGRPMTVILNSPGGRVLDGLALFDYLSWLRSEGHHLRIEVLGRAASMGGVLLQAGDERVVGANAFLLVHEVSGGAEGKSSELGDRVEFYDQMEKRLLAILASRSTLTERQIKARWSRKDWWLTAQEAVEVGLADSIL